MRGSRDQAGVRAAATTALGLVMVAALIVGPSRAAGNTTAQPGVVDLAIQISAQPNPALAGSIVQYESLIRNRGTLVAEGVQAVFEIPAAGVSASTGSSSCTIVGSTRLELDGSGGNDTWTVTCNVGALAPGATTRLALSVTAGTFGTHTSLGTVSSDKTDDRASDNQVEIPVYVLPEAPSISPAFLQPGRSNPWSRTTA